MMNCFRFENDVSSAEKARVSVYSNVEVTRIVNVVRIVSVSNMNNLFAA